jgi:uncharacterized protein (DUF885 family)
MTTDHAALRALADAATPGPWEVERDPYGDDDYPVSANGRYLCVSPDDGVRGGHSEADAAFIAAARDAVPALLDEVERLRKELRECYASGDGALDLVEDDLTAAREALAAEQRKTEAVRVLADKMTDENGQSWNSISGRRIRAALGEDR